MPSSSFETFVVQEGLPAPVPVPGEPSAASRQATNDPGGRAELPLDVVVHVPASWTTPSGQAVLCPWTEHAGLHTCIDLSANGHGPVAIEMAGNAEPGEQVEIWLATSDATVERRLYAGAPPREGATLNLVLAAGYETLADVLTKQPPASGNYLEPST